MKKVRLNAVLPLNSFTFVCRAPWLVVLGTLLLAAAAPRPAQAITINMEYTDEGDDPPHDENPSWDPAGVILKAHFQRAKQIWEALLLGPEDYTFDFHWDNDIDDPDEPGITLGLTTDDAFDTYIEINPDASWFADRTPENDDEFDVTNGQTLFGELSLANQSYFPGSAPPGALEVGFRGAGIAGVPGAGGFHAQNGNDLLSTVVHEIGHVLGIGADVLGNRPLRECIVICEATAPLSHTANSASAALKPQWRSIARINAARSPFTANRAV